MSKKKVFLHIGVPKTGTSAIQDYLVDANGIEVSVPSFIGLGKYFFGHSSVFRHFGDACDKSKIIKSIDEAERDVVVLSDELLSMISSPSVLKRFDSPEPPPKLKEYKENICKDIRVVPSNIADVLSRYDLKVVFYYRNQVDSVESFWIQTLKHYHKFDFRSIKGVDKFVAQLSPRDMLESDEVDYLRYDELYEHWAALVGGENVICRLYDRDTFPSRSAVADFCDLTGIRHDKSLSQKMNIPRHYLEYGEINANFGSSDRGVIIRQQMPDLYQDIKKYFSESNQRFFKIITPEERKLFMRGDDE